MDEQEYEALLDTIDGMNGPLDVAMRRLEWGNRSIEEPETAVSEYEGW